MFKANVYLGAGQASDPHLRQGGHQTVQDERLRPEVSPYIKVCEDKCHIGFGTGPNKGRCVRLDSGPFSS